MMKLRFLACACIAVPTLSQAQLSVDFPLGVGIHTPTYDRVDGMSIPYGPTISVGDDRLVIDPLITYRSHLGSLDPSLGMVWRPDSLLSFSMTGARTTLSNDAWIRSNLMNSLYALFLGVDARNYYRADRAEGKVAFNIPMGSGTSDLYTGIRFENDWSTGWRVGERQGPYSFYNRPDTANGTERPNPLVDRGHIASLLVGAESQYEIGRFSSRGNALFEGGWHTPMGTRFQQITVHDEGTVRTWGAEQVEWTVHVLTTPGGVVPRQRYAYLGGSGTLATVDLLTLGGDHMYFVDALYIIPIPRLNLPVLGSAFVAPHFVTGGAGVGGFGQPVQNAGIRLGSGVARLDFLVNPRTHKGDLGVGFAFSR
jgi:hypothetical protein